MIQTMNPSEIGTKLEKIVKCTISWDRHVLDCYSVDSSSYILKPLVVAFPRTGQDVTSIIKFAKKHHIPITPRGAGTGLVGSALGRGIILDMRHFDKIRVGKDHVTVGSGVTKGYLDKILQKYGRFIGPDPSIGPFCTMGGMIGTNASGPHSLKYGSVIDNLIAVKIADSFGKIIKLPDAYINTKNPITSNSEKLFPTVSKNSCGYRIDKIHSKKDWHKIIAGSEGTLGIIISAKLATYSSPKNILLCIIQYKTLLDAVRDTPKIVKLKPSALELIDSNIVKHIKIKTSHFGCLLFVEFNNNITYNKKQIQDIISGKIIKTESDKDKIKRLWGFRNSALAYSLRSIKKSETMPTLIEDAVVPIKRLPLLLAILDMISKKYGLKMIIYGHAGNGNLHIRPVLKQKDISKIKRIAREFFTGVIEIGGSITGEHGDGLARSEFVKMQYGNDTYTIFKNIKKQFDPTNILNPGKIITNKSTVTKNLKF